jgi:hypothetical protein
MTSKQIKPRTAADFRAAHDKAVIVPNKIRAALVELLKIGPEHFEYDNDFMRLAGVSNIDMAAYRLQFAHYWFDTPGKSGGKGSKRVWFGNPKVAARLRTSPPDKE